MKILAVVAFLLGTVVGAAFAPSTFRSSVLLTTPNVSTGSQPITDTGSSVMRIEFDAAASTVRFVAPYGTPTVVANRTTAFAVDSTVFQPVNVIITGIALVGTQGSGAGWSDGNGHSGTLASNSQVLSNLAADFKTIANHANLLMLNGNLLSGTQNPW